MDEDVIEIQRLYPQIFLACHLRHARKRSTPYKLTERDSSVLAHIDSVDGIASRDLAKHMGVGAPTMSAALKRLETAGYVDVNDLSHQHARIFLLPQHLT